MTSSYLPPSPPPPEQRTSAPTLGELLAAHGRRTVPPALQNIARLAAEAHAQRWRDGVADRELVNRSTAFWAVLAGDLDVALAVAEGNLTADALKRQLRITIDPSAPPPADAEVDPHLDSTLVRAIEEYLDRSEPGDDFDVVDLGSAILLSGLGPGGLLPGRLSGSGADIPAALDALGRLRSGSGVSGLSRSVRQARHDLGPEELVTVFDLVRALDRVHPFSPLTEVGSADTDADTGRETTDWWLGQVRAAYDPAEVLRSERGIVDVELTVRALVDLDPSLSRSLRGEKEINQWLDKIRPRPAAERKTEPSADIPAPVDLLGRETLAATLADQLEVIGQRGESSLLIHLDGPWGSGKSSLLGFLRKELDGTKKRDPGEPGRTERRQDYLVVEVDAWREQRVGAQWWTLYRALRAAHLDAAGTAWRRLGSRVAHMGDVLVVRRDKLWPVLLSVVVLGLGLGLWVKFGIGKDLGLPEVISVAAVVFTGLTASYRFLAPVSPRSARAMVESSTNPMAEVRDLFGRSLDRAAPRPVIFLVDDLDRCEPDYVIRFLEVVQTLVRDAPPRRQPRDRDGEEEREEPPAADKHPKRRGPYAVVAADGGWLRSCYQKTYGDLVIDDQPGKPLGYRFLEKIFQMHIRLPNVEHETKQKYYESLLFPEGSQVARPSALDRKLCDDVTSRIGAGVHSTEDLSDLNGTIGRIADSQLRQSLRATAIQQAVNPVVLRRQLHELSPFAELLESNPRTIRLFVNAVSMQTYLRFLEGASFATSSLALWGVLEARWPALADHLREHPEDAEITDPESESARHLSPELRALLTGPEVAAVLRSDRWPPLDEKEVRACTGRGLLAADE